LGAVVDGKLVDILVWSQVEDGVWESNVLAAAQGSMKHGYAIRLKRELIELARLSGVTSIRSLVDFSEHGHA
jgi:hypothetical protein